jgi:hypothetical protein
MNTTTTEHVRAWRQGHEDRLALFVTGLRALGLDVHTYDTGGAVVVECTTTMTTNDDEHPAVTVWVVDPQMNSELSDQSVWAVIACVPEFAYQQEVATFPRSTPLADVARCALTTVQRMNAGTFTFDL